MDAQATDAVTVTLVGGPTALIEVGGLRLLTDPLTTSPQLAGSAAPRSSSSRGATR
jgi:L-ascorbate metabolism protein UlaG (beta-lactamase superfamily)